jgi:hypothetical protein
MGNNQQLCVDIQLRGFNARRNRFRNVFWNKNNNIFNMQ